MQNRVILGVNPGARHLGYALFQNSELLCWGIKAANERWSSRKKKKIGHILQNMLEEFNPDYVALKKLHPSRSSPELTEQTTKLKELCRARDIPVYEYPIQYLENIILTERMNKKKLNESIYELYPVLFHEIEKERLRFEKNKKRSNERIYYTRMFEAVALAHVCFNQLDNQ